MKANEKAYREACGKLDAAVRHARRLHKEAVKKMEDAQAEVAELRKYSNSDPVKKAKADLAQAEFNQAREALRPTLEKVWRTYDMTVNEARTELVEALGASDTYRATDIDTAALALLESGIMRPQDYRQMVADFSENAAMLAVLRSKINDQMDKLTAPEDYQTRAELLAVVQQAKTSGQELVESFDALNSAVRTFAGRTPHGDWRSAEAMTFTGSLDAWESFSAPYIDNKSEE